jgi:lipoate-protein ligase A
VTIADVISEGTLRDRPRRPRNRADDLTPPRLLAELDPAADPQRALAGEEALMATVAEERREVLRVWECAEAIVISRRLRRQLGDADLGPGVLVRSSGGTAVALGPGVVCISLALPLIDGRPLIEAGYRRWIEGLASGLGPSYGVEVSAAAVPGAFCDGNYNAVVGTRKLAGTAQARRRGVLLVHGCLLVDVDRERYCRRLAAVEDETDPALITTLREEAGREIDRGELLAAIAAGFGAEPSGGSVG